MIIIPILRQVMIVEYIDNDSAVMPERREEEGPRMSNDRMMVRKLIYLIMKFNAFIDRLGQGLPVFFGHHIGDKVA